MERKRKYICPSCNVNMDGTTIRKPRKYKRGIIRYVCPVCGFNELNLTQREFMIEQGILDAELDILHAPDE